MATITEVRFSDLDLAPFPSYPSYPEIPTPWRSPWAEELEESVRDMAVILDEHEPGWYERVTEPLDMISPKYCLLGQVYERYGGLRPGRRFFIGPRKPDLRPSGYGIGLFKLGRLAHRARETGAFSAQRAAKLWMAEIEKRRS